MRKKSGFQRILVIGCGGSGKSTFSAKLARATGLPIHHLDSLYWRPGWNHPPKAQWEGKVRELVRRRKWIIDGSYFGTLDLRLSQADAVVFFDLSRWICLWRVLKRRVQNMGRGHRLGMPEGCPERIYGTFLKWIWNYRKTDRPKVMEKMARFSEKGRVFHVEEAVEARRLIENFHSF